MGASDSQLVELATSTACTLPQLLANAKQRPALRGQAVALMAHPGLGWVEAYLSLLCSGAVAVPIPLGATARELEHIFAQANVTRALGDQDHWDKLRALIEPEALEAWRETPSQEAAPSAPTLSDEDPALVLFTSGTTGKPKAAVLSHGNLFAQTSALREHWGFHAQDVLACALPFHHLHGVVVALLTALSAGASVRVFRRFEARSVLSELERCSVFMGVPTMYQRFVELLGGEPELARGARALRLATSGSAALSATLAAEWRRFAGALPLERYGMTEIGIALSNPLAPEQRRPGQVGQPLASVELRVVDEQGQDTEDAGELWVRGPMLFAGYLSGGVLQRPLTPDGYFQTGDVVRRSAEGGFTILGRASSDILKTGGEKVSALEIEEACREHPAVAEAAVIGVPDPVWGDKIVAFIVLRRPASAAVNAGSISAAAVSVAAETEPAAWLKSFLRERLSPFKLPKEIRLVDELPRNAMGKVLKQELRR